MSEGIFKSTMFGGFDKKSVLDYIEKTEKVKMKKKEEISSRFELINAEKERVASDFFALQEKNKTLEQNIIEGNTAFEDLMARNKELANQSIQYKMALSDRDKLIRKLQQEIDEIKNHYTNDIYSYQETINTQHEDMKDIQRKTAYYKSKSDRLDRLNDNIDDVIEKTKKRTRFLVEKAYRDTKSSSKNITDTLEESVLRMEYFQKEVRSLKAFMEGFNKDFINQLDEMDRSVDYSINEIDVDGSKMAEDIIKIIEELLNDDDFSYDIAKNLPSKSGKNGDDEDDENLNFQEKSVINTGEKAKKIKEEINFPIKSEHLKQKNSRLVKEEIKSQDENAKEVVERINQSESSFKDINFFLGE